MAEFVLQDEARFPEGATVGAYPASNWPTPGEPAGEPLGSATEEAEVEEGKATFTELKTNTKYWLVAEVAEAYVYVSAFTGTASGVVTQDELEVELEAYTLETTRAASGMGAVVGGEASTARPKGYACVTWVQKEEPENAEEGDVWIEAEV